MSGNNVQRAWPHLRETGPPDLAQGGVDGKVVLVDKCMPLFPPSSRASIEAAGHGTPWEAPRCPLLEGLIRHDGLSLLPPRNRSAASCCRGLGYSEKPARQVHASATQICFSHEPPSRSESTCVIEVGPWSFDLQLTSDSGSSLCQATPVCPASQLGPCTRHLCTDMMEHLPRHGPPWLHPRRTKSLETPSSGISATRLPGYLQQVLGISIPASKASHPRPTRGPASFLPQSERSNRPGLSCSLIFLLLRSLEPLYLVDARPGRCSARWVG